MYICVQKRIDRQSVILIWVSLFVVKKCTLCNFFHDLNYDASQFCFRHQLSREIFKLNDHSFRVSVFVTSNMWLFMCDFIRVTTAILYGFFLLHSENMFEILTFVRWISRLKSMSINQFKLVWNALSVKIAFIRNILLFVYNLKSVQSHLKLSQKFSMAVEAII